MRILHLITLVTLFGIIGPECQAQGLFGNRTLGGSVSKRSAPTSNGPQIGNVETGRRFLRDERSVNDFVGSSVSGGTAGFVGGQSAVSAAISSVTGLAEEARPALNRPRIIRPTGLYAERLTFEDAVSRDAVAEQASPTLSSSLRSLIQQRSVTIEVSPEGRSAILRGSVPSEHDRQTTELLVMFEPGIEKVENHLIVDADLLPIPRRSRDRNSH